MRFSGERGSGGHGDDTTAILYSIIEVRLKTHADENGERMASILLLAIIRITRHITSVLVLRFHVN